MAATALTYHVTQCRLHIGLGLEVQVFLQQGGACTSNTVQQGKDASRQLCHLQGSHGASGGLHRAHNECPCTSI